jgi:4-cresol dehydrogenase (hydroxylating)
MQVCCRKVLDHRVELFEQQPSHPVRRRAREPHRQLNDFVEQGGIFTSALQRYALDNTIPYWGLQLSFYGPAKVCAAQWEAVQDLASKAIKGVRFEAGRVLPMPLGDQSAPEVHAQQVGIPNLEFFAFGSRAGGNPHPSSGHIWFAPVIPRSGEAILQANRVFDEASRTIPALRTPILGLQPFALPACQCERSFMFIMGFPMMDDTEKDKASVDAFRALVRIGAEHGWGEYRTPVIFQDQVMNTYSYNNHSLLRFHEAVKDAIDPNGILSPGRYGIWPKNMRKEKS